MSDHLTISEHKQGIADGVQAWMNSHLRSTADALAAGVNDALTAWLDRHCREIIEAIADRVAGQGER